MTRPSTICVRLQFLSPSCFFFVCFLLLFLYFGAHETVISVFMTEGLKHLQWLRMIEENIELPVARWGLNYNFKCPLFIPVNGCLAVSTVAGLNGHNFPLAVNCEKTKGSHFSCVALERKIAPFIVWCAMKYTCWSHHAG